MRIIANNQTYEDSTWLPGKDEIWIDRQNGEIPILSLNIPATLKLQVYQKLKEQAEKHPDYVNVDEAYDEVCKEEYEKCKN